MEHKSIVLTPENQKQVAGRLNKFFKKTETTHNVYHWHNYDSGWNFKPYANGRRVLHSTAKVTVRDHGVNIVNINWPNGNGYAIKFGARLRFQGNKILIQYPWYPEHNYIYLAFQLERQRLNTMPTNGPIAA